MAARSRASSKSRPAAARKTPPAQRAPAAPPARTGVPRPKVTGTTLGEMKRRGERIVMLTAYDYPFAKLVDAAGADVILVGDSLGMVVLGFESTLPVTMQHVLHHSQAVVRAKPRALVVADLPFMSFQVSPQQALRNAGRLLKEGGVEAVKLEGGERVLPMVEAITRHDIPVMGHLGLTPQSVRGFGGYRVQGRSQEAAARLQRDARALEAAGCFAIVLEAIPASLAATITSSLRIPTIGIGAGLGCDGQVLVLHDVLGLFEEFTPKFVRRYGELGAAARGALDEFVRDVRAGRFPGREHTYGS